MINEFLAEQCLEESGNEALSIESEELRAAYLQYCLDKLGQYLDEAKFGAALKARGIIHKQKGGKKHRRYFYIGIKLKDDLLRAIEQTKPEEFVTALQRAQLSFQRMEPDYPQGQKGRLPVTGEHASDRAEKEARTGWQ